MKVNIHLRKCLLMGLWVLSGLAASAQNQTVSINVKNATLKNVFSIIEKQTSYRFSFMNNVVSDAKDVSVQCKNATVASVLKKVLPGKHLNYRLVSEKSIVVYEAKQEQKASQAPASKITGTVIDENGDPVIGASIFDKATQKGAITDLDGNFSLEVPVGNNLTISYVGYMEQQLKASNKMRVQLKPDTRMLDDVVVVGYGTQKKLNTTGAVTKVEGAEIGKMVQTNVAKSLQGISPGITIMDRGGAPGNDDPEIYLRGVSTTGYSKPLVLVDGVEMPLSLVPASEIENVSVLKDASSAAIYGSRAANGVILVTTKRGSEGKFSISYNGTVGFQDRAVKPEPVSGREYMELVNEALVNAGSPEKYTEEQMTAVENGTDKYNIDYTDWPSKLYKKRFITQHTLTMNGGTSSNSYMISFDYLNQPGLTDNTSFDRYSYRMNYDINLTKYLKFSSDFTYRHIDRSNPEGLGGAQETAFSMGPTTPCYYEDGSYRLDQQNNNTLSLVDLDVVGRDKYKRDVLYGQAKFELTPIKDLVFTGTFSINGNWDRHKIHYKNHKYYNGDGALVTQRNNPNGVSDQRNNSYEMTARFLANYKKSFGNHNLAFLYGMEQITYKNSYSYAERKNLISDNMPDVSLGSAGSQYAKGYPTRWGINSFFGRFNYNYMERYLFEADLRSDGSSRFAKGHKWGTFPSFSAAWRISEENFIKNNVKWIDNLKLRGSWGQTGNNHIGEFQYLAQYDVSNVVMDGQLVSAVYQQKMSNPLITWETVEQTDIGLDFNLFGNTIYGSFDWYSKDTKDILLTLAIPHYIGLDAPEQNAGKVRNSGFEAQIGYRQTFGDVNFNTSLNFAYNKNKWVDRGEDDGNISGYTIQKEGYALNSYYMYRADGLIANDEELAAYKAAYKSDPRGMSELKAGDVKLVDTNGDGTIDPNDREIFEPNIPKWTFGWNISAEYKGFDLSLLFQGTLGANRVLYGEFIEGPSYEVFTSKIFRNRWTVDNQNPHADMPRLEAANNRNESTFNSFNLHKSNYLRLKNLQFGYTFQPSLCKQIGLQSLRLYVSGSNLFTWSSLFQGLDPEGFSDRIHYFPQLKIMNFGVNIVF